MVGCLAPGLEVRPAGFLRYPEDVFGNVFVAVLRGFLPPLSQHRRVALFEGVRDVLQEDDAEHDVLVLGGIHRAAKRIGHRPQLGLVAGGGAAVGLLACHLPRCLHSVIALEKLPRPGRSPRYDM